MGLLSKPIKTLDDLAQPPVLKDIALSILANSPETHLILLLVDERPEPGTLDSAAERGAGDEVQ